MRTPQDSRVGVSPSPGRLVYWQEAIPAWKGTLFMGTWPASQLTARSSGARLGTLPLVEASGAHGELGRQIGAGRAHQVQSMVETYRRVFRDHGSLLGVSGWRAAVRHARRYLPISQRELPQYVEEMRGIAEGAGVGFDDILVLNTLEAITDDRLLLGCTSLAVDPTASADGSVWLAHNEDWYPEDLDHVYLVRAEPEDEPPFLALSYGGLLPNIGFNAAGVAQCCDTVYPTDARLGLPRVLVSRAVLGAESIHQAMLAALHPQRAAGYNHLLASDDGTIYNLEASAADFDLIPAQGGVAAHTNHYRSERMQALEKNPEKRRPSRDRLERAEARLTALQGRIDQEDLASILADHEGQPRAICCHAQDQASLLERQRTIASLVIDLTHRRMYAAWGNPCQAEFTEFHLAEDAAPAGGERG